MFDSLEQYNAFNPNAFAPGTDQYSIEDTSALHTALLAKHFNSISSQ